MKIFNTLTRKKEDFIPADPKNVKMFVCGPTVYDYIHVGNARTYTVFDMVAKYLRHKGYGLEYIQNITDIEDKIIARALDLKLDPIEYARDYTDIFYEDIKKIGITSVDHYEPATKNIDQVIKQVQTLIKKGNAYKIATDGWYFDLETFPKYGKLSGRTVEMAEDGVSRIDQGSDKRNKGDFCLWKFSKPEEPGWDSELGYGRPGWHIEDTAITEKFFGPQYDLHGAAADLVFPHHEAEIAQQESASGLEPFVRYWMHAGFLVNKTQKMSKSLGNFMTLREALKEYKPEVLRFYFLSSHYRSPLDYSEDNLKQAEAGVARISEFKNRLENSKNAKEKIALEQEQKLQEHHEKITQAMDDDFNTPEAFAGFFELIRESNGYLDKNIDISKNKFINDSLALFKEVLGVVKEGSENIPSEVKELIIQRQRARENKDFALSDKIRDQISDLGYDVADTSYGPLAKKQ